MRYLIALAAMLLAGPAFAQTCPPLSTATPQPWNESRVKWTAPTTYTDGTAFVAGTVLTYTVYRKTGTAAFAALCTTTATSTSLSSQPTGTNTYTVTAKTMTSAESGQPTPASKDVTEPPVSTPTNITVASTRIDQFEWTCRDSAGAVLTNHRSQVEAQTSCTNAALSHVGAAYEIRPSGYRITAK